MVPGTMQSFRFRAARVCCVTGLWASLLAGCASMQQNAHEQQGERLGRELSAQIAEIMAVNHVYETATPLLQEGINEDPNNPHLHRLLGVVLRDRGVFEQAREELELSWQLAPYVPDTAAALGVLFDSTQRPAAAEIWHRRAIDLAPRKGELYNNLGFSLYLQGRDAEAMVTLREGLRHNPNQARAFNNLGFTYFRLHERELAMKSFRQAGTRANAMANFGVALEMSGEMEEARQAYVEALRLDQRLEVARKNLAQLEREPH
jgi:Flp pilus assembly protein TadD